MKKEEVEKLYKRCKKGDRVEFLDCAGELVLGLICQRTHHYKQPGFSDKVIKIDVGGDDFIDFRAFLRRQGLKLLIGKYEIRTKQYSNLG